MTEQTSPSVSIRDFFTREDANEGTTLPLFTPSGDPTDHWIKIRSIDSDEYRKAEMDMRRAIYSNPVEEGPKREAWLVEQRTKLIASLVIGWSLPDPCTIVAREELVREAPALSDKIEELASKRALFVKKKPQTFSGSPSNTSTSPSQSKAAKPQSGARLRKSSAKPRGSQKS